DCPIVKAGQGSLSKKKNESGASNVAVGLSVSELPTTYDDDDDFDHIGNAYQANVLNCSDNDETREHLSTISDKTEDWINDSGCTHHLTNNFNILESPRQSNLIINTAGKFLLKAKAKGAATLILKNGSTLRLNEVHYVPSLHSNLLSVTMLNANGIDVLFGDSIKIIERSNGRVFAIGSRKNRLPILEVKSRSIQNNNGCGTATIAIAKTFHVTNISGTLQEWHERLGHVSKQSIVKLAEKLGSEKMKITRLQGDLTINCLDCKRGKQRRNSQPRGDTGDSAPTDQPGAVICADLLGPITPMDRNKNKYVAVYVDHATKMKHAVPIRQKSDQLDEFIALKQLVEN
ncbi:hypothetical protein LEN26_020319, partial [Aphanomyces euteiches]